jgi:hypothetical protein
MTSDRKHPETPMEAPAGERVKVWTRLGTCLVTGAALSLASGGVSGQALKAGTALDQPGSSMVQLAQAEGGEGGEGGEDHRIHQGGEGGEGGEGGGGEGGEGGDSASLATDDAAYLTRLGLVRGHLDVGVDLYREGAAEAAITHMKHPGDELYAGLVPALEARGAPGFAEDLSKLASLVESGAPASEVESAYAALQGKIGDAEAVAFDDGGLDLKTRLAVILKLMRTSAEEYAIGVRDGKVVNAHEYQDALGFVRVADRLLQGVSEEERGSEAVAATREQLDALAVAWPSLIPPDRIETSPSLLYGAAARVEIASLSVD